MCKEVAINKDQCLFASATFFVRYCYIKVAAWYLPETGGPSFTR